MVVSFRRRMRERSLHGYFLIPAFDDGRDHFNPHVGFDGIAGMGRNDDSVSCVEEVRLIVDDDLSLAIDDLNKCIEGRDLLGHRFARVKRGDRYVTSCLLDDRLDHD